MENGMKGMEQIRKLMDPANQARMLPMWIAMGTKEIVEQSLE